MIKRFAKLKDSSYKLQIDNYEIYPENTVTLLLGIYIDKLNFEKGITATNTVNRENTGTCFEAVV